MTLIKNVDVLIVDDDDAIRRLLATAFSRLGLSCQTAVDGADALNQIALMNFSVVLVDLMMPRVDGGAFVVALAEHERTSTQRPVVLMMTAFPPSDAVTVAPDRIQAVIRKPFDVVEFAELVHDCVEVRRLFGTRGAAAPPPIADGPAQNSTN